MMDEICSSETLSVDIYIYIKRLENLTLHTQHYDMVKIQRYVTWFQLKRSSAKAHHFSHSNPVHSGVRGRKEQGNGVNYTPWSLTIRTPRQLLFG
jgi:hypothetical protein